MNLFRAALNKGHIKPDRQDQGFTILEVLIAVVILGLSYVAVLQSFSFSMRNISRIEEELTTDFPESASFLSDARFDGGTGVNGETTPGQDYIIGQKYRLVQISSEDGELVTLRLDRL